MVSMGGQGSQTDITTRTHPGSYGDASYNNSARLSKLMEGLVGNFKSPYSQPLESAILRPDYAPTSSSETALLDSLMSQTAGRSAVSGMGAPTQSSLASTIAPTLVGLRQQNIENLQGARGQDIQLNQADLAALAELIKLAMPQVVSGQKGDSWGWNAGILSCWVAREIYGTNTPVWKVFRCWLLNDAPKWFKWIYLTFGEKVSKFIHNKPKIKKIIGKHMDKIVIHKLGVK